MGSGSSYVQQAKSTVSSAKQQVTGTSGNYQISEPYEQIDSNWFKALPYGFAFFNRNAGDDSEVSATSIIYLPILPSNITVTTHFATNIVTTLYGVVEEHSEVRYYDIEINGTTGIAPRFVGEKSENSSANVGRSSFADSSLVDDFGGFLPEITNTINQVNNTLVSVAEFATGSGPSMPTGVQPQESGYSAFHKLYKFLLKYKKDAAGAAGVKSARKTHPIQFLNYKDNVKYDCVPTQFNLNRNAENPMLYNYSIKMRCYNLRNVSDTVQEADQLARLGLGNATGQSVFSNLTGAASNAATLVSGIL